MNFVQEQLKMVKVELDAGKFSTIMVKYGS